MDSSARGQLESIQHVLDVAVAVEARVWLRGGWAMDFFLGRVTRHHVDIDWFALVEDASRLRGALLDDGFRDVTIAPPEQQMDLVRGSVDHGIALVRVDRHGIPVVAGGPWVGAPWPEGMLTGRCGQIGSMSAPIISPGAQIEIKRMMPTWNPKLRRRLKDLDDIDAIAGHLA